jgi:oxalate decarboxylase/phosphoglucose isomerase-like protein (cupin superfamily)
MAMVSPRIVRPEEVPEIVWPGGGRGRRMVHPDVVGSKKLVLGIIRAEPGKSPHRWHTHTRDKGEGFEVEYPPDFDEAYAVIKGKRTLFRREGGREMSAPVREGDVIYFPIGVAESQLVNTGDEDLVIVFATTPPVKIVK